MSLFAAAAFIVPEFAFVSAFKGFDAAAEQPAAAATLSNSAKSKLDLEKLNRIEFTPDSIGESV